MKFTTRFMVRAALVLTAGGVIGAFGACKEGAGPTPPPPPVPPPPPPTLAAPTELVATAISQTRIELAWKDNATTETGYKVERCSGPGCTNFAQIGANTAADVKAFVDTFGLAASTQYAYRVSAFNATATSGFATANGTTLGEVIIPGITMVGAGEITSCASQGSVQTARLIDSIVARDPNTIVFTTGNNVADSTSNSYATCFAEPRWGKFLSRMRPAIGQRDYDKGPNAAFEYFGDKLGTPGKGWYSFDVGTNWHVIVLNTATWQWGSQMMTDPGSEQNQWLAADLAQSAGKKCTIAIMNLRRYYSYGSFENMNVKNIWNTLHAAGVEMVINGYDKYYERWNPQDHDMHADPTGGVVQFTVGTGGRTLDNFGTAWKPVDQVPNLAVRDASTWGVLKLTLNDNSYQYEFIPTMAGGFTDKSAAPVPCH